MKTPRIAPSNTAKPPTSRSYPMQTAQRHHQTTAPLPLRQLTLMNVAKLWTITAKNLPYARIWDEKLPFLSHSIVQFTHSTMVFIMNLAQPVMIKSLAGFAVLMEFSHFTHMPLHLFMYFMRTVISERWGFLYSSHASPCQFGNPLHSQGLNILPRQL